MDRLTDILSSIGNDFEAKWDSTEAAPDVGPIPKGEYTCYATKGSLEKSRVKGTPSYRIEFTVIKGKFKGRKLWLDCWMTKMGLPYTKREVAKLGIKSLDQMEQPLPRWIRCAVKVVVWTADTGSESNNVVSFEVLGIDKPEVDPFAPPPGGAAEPDGVDNSFRPQCH